MELIINGETIDADAFQRELQSTRANNRDLNDKEVADLARQNIIDQVLLRQEANRRFPQLSPEEVEASFKELKQSHGGDEQFYNRFNLSKKDDERIKKDLEQNLRFQRLLQDLTKHIEEPSESAQRAYFEKNQAEFVKPEEIRAAHIVKAVNPANPLSTYNEMKDIRQKLLDGSTFADIADQFSSCDDQGGDLGFFSRGKMVEEFDVIVFSMQVGEISPIFQTQFGYHLATVYEKRPESPMTFDEAREDIKKRLDYDNKNQYIGRFVDKLAAKAEIKTKE